MVLKIKLTYFSVESFFTANLIFWYEPLENDGMGRGWRLWPILDYLEQMYRGTKKLTYLATMTKKIVSVGLHFGSYSYLVAS